MTLPAATPAGLPSAIRRLPALLLNRYLLLLLSLLLLPAAAGAASPAKAPIVASIEADSVSAVVVPPALMQRLMPLAPGERPDTDTDAEAQPQKRTSGAGWRVQVFSDNNPRTARNEARSKEQQIASAFPQWRTYKKYTAPYWRLRVGDFRTQREAQEAADALRRAFPAFSQEIRVVNDRVNFAD